MIRVVVVDDDFMVAKVHRGFVDRVPGFTTVGVAHTGADALAQAPDADLLLLDIYLPDISGLEVLRRLREAPRSPDVLAVTAARDVATVRSALHGGVVHYVLKPFTFDVLRDRLERYADAYGRLSSNGDVAQSDVDDLFVALRSAASPPLPKGLTADTSALIADAMRAVDGDLSAGECAERIGLSRVSTRRYLEHFAEAGKAEVRLRYGTAGRPQRRYRWIA